MYPAASRSPFMMIGSDLWSIPIAAHAMMENIGDFVWRFNVEYV
jgi:hypothetical protein